MAEKIAIVTAVYPPEPVVSALLSRDLADALREAGWEVVIICPRPSRPVGAAFPPRNGADSPDIELVEVDSHTSPQGGLLGRLFESWSFGRAAARALAQRHWSGVYANVWPLLAQRSIAKFCDKRKLPLVMHVQDVYPEALATKLMPLVQRILLPALILMDAWVAKRCALIVVLSRKIEDYYSSTRKIPRSRIMVRPNWQDEARYANVLSRTEVCRIYGVDDSLFTYIYVGNIGPLAGLEGVINAFAEAQWNGAQLIIVGDGTAKSSCEKLAQRLMCSRIKFLSDPDVNHVGMLHSLGHVCVLPMLPGSGLSSIPSKLSGYMLSGRPVLAIVDAESEVASIVAEAGCGWVGEAGDLGWLPGKMRVVATMAPYELDAIGRNGRDYALKWFSRSSGAKKLAEALVGVMG